MGEARQFWPVSKCQTGTPVLESSAVSVPPLSPKNTRPPAVASVPEPPPPPLGNGYSHAFKPVWISMAPIKLRRSPCRSPKDPPKNRWPICGGVGSLRIAEQSSESRTKNSLNAGSRDTEGHFWVPVWHVSVPSTLVSARSVKTGRPSLPYPVVQFCLTMGVASSSSPLVRSSTKKKPFTSECNINLRGRPSHGSSSRMSGPLESQSWVSCGVNW